MQLPPHWIPTKIVHLSHKLKHKSNIHLSKHSSLSRSPIIVSRMSKHYKVVLNKLQFLKKLLCPKAKVLKDNVGEMKAILQSREKEKHVKIKANSQDYEVQSNLQNQHAQP